MCSYSDYTRTESGLQYQDLREGTGKGAKPGAQVTVDWDGYTIGAEQPHIIHNSTISVRYSFSRSQHYCHPAQIPALPDRVLWQAL